MTKHGLPGGWDPAVLSALTREVRVSVRPDPAAEYELWSVPAYAQGEPERLLGADIGSTKRVVQPADVLLCKINPRINRVWQVGARPPSGVTQIASPEWIVLRVIDPQRVDPHYLRHFLRSPAFRRRIESTVHGVTGSHTRARVPELMTTDVPVPLLREQRRIVEILEDHLSRLDAANAYLDAVEGRARSLVAASARSHVDAASVTAASSTVGAHAVLIEYGTSTKTSVTATGVPVLRMGNIKHGRVLWDGLKYLPNTHQEFPRLLLESGDLLFNRTNSAEHVGKCAVFRDERPASFASYLIRARFDDEVLPEWASLVINSPQGRHYVASVVSQQVGQANVNGSKLRSFPLPVPSIEEQTARVRDHEALIATAETARTGLRDARTRSESLRRSLLAAAFSGRLTGRSSDLDLAEEMALA